MSDDYLIWYRPSKRSRKLKVHKVVGDKRDLAAAIIDLGVEDKPIMAVLRNGAMIQREKL